MEQIPSQPRAINVRSVDSAIIGSVSHLPTSLRTVLDWVVILYVAYWILAPIIGRPQLEDLALRATDGYRPITWVIGLVLGIGLASVYNSQVAPRIRAVKTGREAFDKLQDSPWWNTFSIVTFVVAVGMGAVEFFLVVTGRTTISRLLFDAANATGSHGMYHLAGIVTGVMVTVSLLGSRLNAWYRLSLLVLSMVSAHVYWHLSYDAYADIDIRVNRDMYPGLDVAKRKELQQRAD